MEEGGHQRELATPLLLSSTAEEEIDKPRMSAVDSLTQRTATTTTSSNGNMTTGDLAGSSRSGPAHHLDALEIDASSLDPSQSYSNNNNIADDADDIPLDPHAMDSGGGDLRSAVLGIIKAMVGPAILYLPHGFVAAGYLVALPIMMCATVLYLHSSKCLLEVWKFENEKQLLPQYAAEDDEEEEEMNDLSLQVTDPTSTSVPASPTNNSNQTKRVVVAAARRSLSYPDLAYRAFGTRGETLVKVGIALMQSVSFTYIYIYIYVVSFP